MLNFVMLAKAEIQRFLTDANESSPRGRR